MLMPVAAGAAWCAAYLAAAAILPRLPEPGLKLGPLVSFLLLLATTAPALHVFINLRTAWYYHAVLIPTFAELAALSGMQIRGPYEPWLTMLLDLSILGYAYCGAKLMGKGIRRDGFLLVALFVVAAADLASVLVGPARLLIASPYAKFFVLNYPAPGKHGVHFMLGSGDVFMLTLLLSYCFRQGLPIRRTWRALLGTLALVGVASWAGQTVLPALPFLALSFLAAHADRFRAVRLDARDRRLLAAGIAGVLLIFAVFGLRKG